MIVAIRANSPRWHRIVRVFTIVLCAVSIARGEVLPEDPGAEAALLSLAGGAGFSIHRTDHFLIAYNTDEDVLREFIVRVESTYRSAYRFLESHDIPHHAPEHRLEILFFATPREFEIYAERCNAPTSGVAGFYYPLTNRAAFYNARNAERLAPVEKKLAEFQRELDNSEGSRRQSVLKQMRILRNTCDRTIETINLLVVQHEVAHQVFFNAGLHARGGDHPIWLVEGLACLFETPPSDNGAGRGAINQYRLMAFREALAGDGQWRNANETQFAEARAAGRMMSLRDLIGSKDFFAAADGHAEQRYAQAWSLVHFLQRRRREDFGVYLTVLAKRPTDREYSPQLEVKLFEETFGPIDEQFEKQWLKYMLHLRVRGNPLGR